MNSKDLAQDWLEQIKSGLEYRRQYGKEDQWARLEAMYANLVGSGADIGPNVIFGMAESVTASLDVYNPRITISPSMCDPRSVDNYVLVQAIDDWLVSELDFAEVVQDVTLHAFLWGRGIVKIGYDSEWGFDSAFDLGSVQQPLGITLTQFAKKTGKRLEHGPASPGMPWIAPVMPHDFVVPWGVRSLDQTPWAAHRVIRHVDLLRDDPKYEKVKNLQPTHSMKDVVESYLTPRKVQNSNQVSRVWTPNVASDASRKAEFIELYEVHDYMSGRVLVISETDTHRNDIDRLQVEGVPFCSLTLAKHPRTFWTTPSADYLRFHQAEQSDIALQAAKQRRLNVLKFLVRKGCIEPGELEKVLSPDIGAVAFTNTNADHQRDITLAPTGSNAELWQEAEFSRRNARETAGLSRNQMGEYDGSSRRTATETASVQQGASMRTNVKQASVGRLYTDVTRKVNQTIFTFWKTPRTVQLSAENWPRFTGEDIRAEYSYNTTFGFARPMDANARRQEAFQIYMLGVNDPYMDQVELRKYLARVYHDVEFNRLFTEKSLNAGLQLQMSGMQGGQRALPQNAG